MDAAVSKGWSERTNERSRSVTESVTGISDRNQCTHTHTPPVARTHTHTHTHTAHCTHTRTHSSSGKLVTGYSSSELAGSVPCTNSVRNVRIGMCAYSNLVSSPGLLHRIQQHEKGWGTWLDCIVSMHIQGYPAIDAHPRDLSSFRLYTLQASA